MKKVFLAAILSVCVLLCALYGAFTVKGNSASAQEIQSETAFIAQEGQEAADGVVFLSAQSESEGTEKKTDMWWLVLSLTAVLGAELAALLIILMRKDAKRNA